MADSCHSPKPEAPADRIPSLTLDEIIEENMNSGNRFPWIQFFQATLVSLAYMFDGQQSFISIFADTVPSWHYCDTRNATATGGGGGACVPSAVRPKGKTDMCNLPGSGWAWDGPTHQTFVSDWGVQCQNSFLTGLPASSFFFGSLLGGFILAPLADSSLLGRKNLLLLSCAIMLLPAVLTIASPNVWVYAALRFVSGFGRAPIGTCSLVLSLEMVGKKWRGQVGVIAFICFAIGFLSLSGIAYLNRFSSWKTLYLYTAIPAVVYCVILHFVANESPRWLYVQGRTREAAATLKSLSPVKKNASNQNNVEDLHALLSKAVFKDDASSSKKPNFYRLVSKGSALRRVLTIGVLSFGVGMVYYGIPLGVGNLGFNTYLGAAFNALSELPSLVITVFFIGRWNRRTSVLAFTIFGGACSIAVVGIGGGHDGAPGWRKGLRISSALISFFCGCMASAVSLIYTMELFPTCVRNSATAVARQAQVLGAVISPLLVSAGRKNDFVFYGVLGIVVIFCGLFVIFLPETKGVALSDSMEEQDAKEQKGRILDV